MKKPSAFYYEDYNTSTDPEYLYDKNEMDSFITNLEKQIKFGLAIVNCLLTDSQLDFRNKNQGTGRLSKLIGPNESIREAAIRIYGNQNS